MTAKAPDAGDNGVAKIQLRGIERYWRQLEGGGDPFLNLYEAARIRTDSPTNLAKQNRFFTLYQMARRVLTAGIPGDVVECGCWHGHSTYIVASVLKQAGWSGRFFVFDSFEGGLSDKVAADREALGDTDPERTAWLKEHFASDFDQVRATLAEFPAVELHRGWIPQVFQEVPDLGERSYALVHVDVDLYEPTRDALAFFGPRMSPGGVIVVDDYGSANFPGAKTAVDEHLAKHPPTFFLESHLIGAVIVY